MSATWPPQSYAALFNEMRACPASLALFLDSELLTLLRDLPGDPGLAQRVMGEALLRGWLYDGHQPAALAEGIEQHCPGPLVAAWRDALLPLRRRRTQIEWRKVTEAPGLAGRDERAWHHAVNGARTFLDCDGVIAVVDTRMTGGEAIAVPFTLAPGEDDNGAVRDATGRPITHWTSALACARTWAGTRRVTLSRACGDRAAWLCGGSFALAVLLAADRQQGDIGDFAPLAVLCTGAVDADGTLKAVDGIVAKRALAARLGAALFIHPHQSAASGETMGGHVQCLPIAPGTPPGDCLEIIGKKLDDLGLTQLDARQAHGRLRALQNDVHEGRVPLDKAARRMERCTQAFATDAESRHAREGMLVVHLLRGAIANHAGDPEAGRCATEKAAELALDLHSPRLYVDAVANTVVSLTDVGLLDDAEALGRHLVHWFDTEFAGGADDTLRCQMIAHGVLGGQPLLQKALCDASLAAESLELLRSSLACAQEAGLRPEIARDAVQIALWHALHAPSAAESAVADAHQTLATLGLDAADASRHYLRNARFLGAYRAMLLGQEPPGMFASWPLPTSPSWLLATALKYRGALHVASGNPEAAARDFAEACSLFAGKETPLLRFIGATAALQAGESLMPWNVSTARTHLERARSVFLALRDVLHGLHRAPDWLERAEGLLAGVGPACLPHPQLEYRY